MRPDGAFHSAPDDIDHDHQQPHDDSTDKINTIVKRRADDDAQRFEFHYDPNSADDDGDDGDEYVDSMAVQPMLQISSQ